MANSNLKGTETEKNLLKAVLGESLARNKYTFFSNIAKKEGYEQIAAIFLETAENEHEHAKLYYKQLGEEKIQATVTFPAGLGTTIQNLQAAYEGEHEENTILYPGFAQVAKDEGFVQIHDIFMNVTEVEFHHEARYRKLHENIEKDLVFKNDICVSWKCRNCGRLVQGLDAPEICPTCFHPKAYFELNCDSY